MQPRGRRSSQTGDSIKTLEVDYAKYIKEADGNRDFVEKSNPKDCDQVKRSDEINDSPTPLEKKKPLENQGLEKWSG
jgi:hypothetical protein